MVKTNALLPATLRLLLVALFAAQPLASASLDAQSQIASDAPRSGSGTQQDQASAGTSSTPSADQVATLKVGTNEVNVVFTVTDKHGRHITDLKQGDLRVLDDKQPPEEVRSFHSETNLPLQVGLLIDASNSVRDRFKFEQASAVEFLNQTVRARYD